MSKSNPKLPESQSNAVAETADKLVPYALRVPHRLYKDLRLLCAMKGTSFNGLALELLEGVVEENSTAIRKAKEGRKLLSK